SRSISLPSGSALDGLGNTTSESGQTRGRSGIRSEAEEREDGQSPSAQRLQGWGTPWAGTSQGRALHPGRLAPGAFGFARVALQRSWLASLLRCAPLAFGRACRPGWAQDRRLLRSALEVAEEPAGVRGDGICLGAEIHRRLRRELAAVHPPQLPQDQREVVEGHVRIGSRPEADGRLEAFGRLAPARVLGLLHQ